MDHNFPPEQTVGDNRRQEINVDIPERIVSAVAGSLLILRALRQGDFNLLRMVAAGYLLYRGSTGHDPIYKALGKEPLPNPVRNINIRTKVTVNRPRQEVYAFWRNFENLPLFMKHLERVRQPSLKLSHWVAKVPGGLGTIEWDAAIVEEREGSFIGWRSLPGATVENAGKVEFKDISDNWTELDVIISYKAPLGAAGFGLGKLLNATFEKMVEEDIKGFKHYIENTAETEETIIIVESVIPE